MSEDSNPITSTPQYSTSPIAVTDEISSGLQKTVPPQKDDGNGGRLFSSILLSLFFILLGFVAGWFARNFPIPFLGTKEAQVSEEIIKEDTGPIVIGGILPLTGDAATYGIPYQQVGLLAQKEINAIGGIAGKKIEILWEDGRCDAESSKVAAEKLINEKNIKFLIGGACSAEYLASAPIAETKKIISFSPSATSPDVSEIGRYIFRLVPSDSLAGKVAAEYAYKKLTATTAAIIAEDTDYPKGLASVFEKEFVKLGGKVIYNKTYKTGTTDFSTFVTEIKKESPGVLYILPQTPTPGVLLVNAIKSQRISSKLLTAEVLLQRDIVQKQGKVLDGIVGVELLFDPEASKTKAFFESFKNEYGLEVSDPAYMSAMYDTFYLIKEAYEKTGGDVEKITDYIYDLKDWEGAIGKVTIDKNGDPISSYSIKLISNNELKQVEIFVPTDSN